MIGGTTIPVPLQVNALVPELVTLVACVCIAQVAHPNLIAAFHQVVKAPVLC